MTGAKRMEQTAIKNIKFDDRGLVPVVTREVDGDVLMLAYADETALRLTLETGTAHYYSRSRQELWRKGATSGNEQAVYDVLVDCDGDTVLYLVKQEGPACHTGRPTCFFKRLTL